MNYKLISSKLFILKLQYINKIYCNYEYELIEMLKNTTLLYICVNLAKRTLKHADVGSWQSPYADIFH